MEISLAASLFCAFVMCVEFFVCSGCSFFFGGGGFFKETKDVSLEQGI